MLWFHQALATYCVLWLLICVIQALASGQRTWKNKKLQKICGGNLAKPHSSNSKAEDRLGARVSGSNDRHRATSSASSSSFTSAQSSGSAKTSSRWNSDRMNDIVGTKPSHKKERDPEFNVIHQRRVSALRSAYPRKSFESNYGDALAGKQTPINLKPVELPAYKSEKNKNLAQVSTEMQVEKMRKKWNETRSIEAHCDLQYARHVHAHTLQAKVKPQYAPE